MTKINIVLHRPFCFNNILTICTREYPKAIMYTVSFNIRIFLLLHNIIKNARKMNIYNKYKF